MKNWCVITWDLSETGEGSGEENAVPNAKVEVCDVLETKKNISVST